VIDYRKTAIMYIFGSYDCKRWFLLGGRTKQGTFSDMGAEVKRTNAKYIRIGFAGHITPDSHIDFIEINTKQFT
jgi:hypothetical protein